MNKRRLKLDFFAILHPLFLMMLGLLFYFFAFILIWFITELEKLIEGKTDRLSYPISLFTSYLSSLFGIIDYVRCGFYSSADYPYTASKGKNASASLVHAYSCTDARATIRRF